VVRAQSKIILPVTTRALTERIARVLARNGQTLRKTRGAPARSAIGDLYILDAKNVIVATNVDLMQLARETGVLKSYEQLIEEDKKMGPSGAPERDNVTTSRPPLRAEERHYTEPQP
jgi:hypothetical protein